MLNPTISPEKGEEDKNIDAAGEEGAGNGTGEGTSGESDDEINKEDFDKLTQENERLAKEKELALEQKNKRKQRAKKGKAKAKENAEAGEDADDGYTAEDIDSMVDARLKKRDEISDFKAKFPEANFEEISKYAEEKDISYIAAHGAMVAEKGEDPATVARANAMKTGGHGEYKPRSSNVSATDAIIRDAVPTFMKNKAPKD